jgi:hypothetical protein
MPSEHGNKTSVVIKVRNFVTIIVRLFHGIIRYAAIR